MRIRDGPGRAENRIQNQNQRAGSFHRRQPTLINGKEGKEFRPSAYGVYRIASGRRGEMTASELNTTLVQTYAFCTI